MQPKPSTCNGCALQVRGYGYAGAIGPPRAKILLVGEALGAQEAIIGKPFVGQAGGMLDRILRLCGFSREQFRIDNTVRCQPPNNWLSGAPWEHDAIEHCAQHIGATLNEEHAVVMPLGGVAARRLMGLPPGVGKMQDLHGTVTRDPLDRFWIVPSFHPSYIVRGAHSLIGAAVHDFRLAAEIALKGHAPDPAKLTIDPSVEWFGEWATAALEHAKITFEGTGEIPWLAVDIETPEKAKGADEGELESGKTKVKATDLGTADKPAALKDPTNIILRVNFAYDPDHGITVPFSGAYKDIIRVLLQSPHFAKVFWNINYDRPRLEINGCPIAEPAHDFMWAWHVLQSDLPRGLGFVAPFYSRYGAWKHLSDESPGEYAAVDGFQTVRLAYGIEEDLRKLRGPRGTTMWDSYFRHVYKLDSLALKPAEDVGLLVDPGDAATETGGLYGFRKTLADEKVRITGEVLEVVPKEIWPRKRYKTLRALTDKDTGEWLPEYEGKVEEVKVTELKNKCSICDKVGVRAGHENTKACGGAQLSLEEVEVLQYDVVQDFNPSSPTQILTYIKSQKHKPGKNKQTKNPSADVSTLEALAKKHKSNKVYPNILELRKVDKMKGTYADGLIKRMDENNRVHSTFTHKPSTLRLSSADPNLQNMAKRGGGAVDEEKDYVKKFRECIIAAPGCVLIEADYAGIEAVQVGWFSGDPNYIRLASMGVHSYLCSHLLGKPADLDWPDDQLAEYLAQFKHTKDADVKEMYARSKRCVHGSNYGMTPTGMRANYPDTFKTLGQAEKVQGTYMEVCPKLHEWQRNLIRRAHKDGYLGGEEHPFGYRHWFWNVINHKKLTKPQYDACVRRGTQVIANDAGYWSVQLGEDAKRAIAFFPQSTAGGVLKEAMLHLFDPEIEETYIGEAYYGRTPFRMPIHDSIVLEVPENKVDFVLERLVAVMAAPVRQQPCPEAWGIGQTDGLKIGVEVEIGKDWANMEEVDVAQYGA